MAASPVTRSSLALFETDAWKFDGVSTCIFALLQSCADLCSQFPSAPVSSAPTESYARLTELPPATVSSHIIFLLYDDISQQAKFAPLSPVRSVDLVDPGLDKTPSRSGHNTSRTTRSTLHPLSKAITLYPSVNPDSPQRFLQPMLSFVNANDVLPAGTRAQIHDPRMSPPPTDSQGCRSCPPHRRHRN